MRAVVYHPKVPAEVRAFLDHCHDTQADEHHRHEIIWVCSE